ncbi:glycoside hydrolase family 15 protein [Streptacidiphilus fuscans]|uniref:Glycoside hydrolase family 15 protein n=1 Tax=Streptacidiphilus fuscans TaxID=2789292 RepID=A0A931B009_9ACTN|nr:glycoside hydrolase family 15 protein [Streptacidiphilus fuscans]MBF9068564.1 glycoside hydrolase family 15 protein [Streptacidiphilus fuscans]
MDPYPPIAEHGIVGDLQTAALVSTGGDIDWWCAPRFDSPSLFASLLDHDKGGNCRLAVDADAVPGVQIKQLYLPDTAILMTRFLAPDGVAEVIDFMLPDVSASAADTHRIFRAARVVRGRVPFVLECRPRFDYGRAAHHVTLLDERSALFQGPTQELYLQATGPVELRPSDQDITARFTLDAGELATVVLTSQSSGGTRPAPLRDQDTRADFDACRDFWYRWLAVSTYAGRWQQIVHRSAITLKLLTYHPSGAPIAAATMGLPEQIGGERNWDYRYTWIRDGSLSVHALMGLGFEEEALAFRHWVRDRIQAADDDDQSEPLQIMYRIDGDSLLTEEVLPHWEGYLRSAPVRAGNAAADQLQLDIYGEAAYAFATGGGDIGTLAGWRAFSDMIDWLAGHWDRPDEGIWETRGGRQDFTYSRLMCWVAFDRAVRIARAFARPADLDRWEDVRDDILRQIVRRGWSQKREAFTQHYATDVLDASLLLMPKVGFLSPTDPAWLSTLDAMDEELVSDSLVYRYDPAASPDGLRGSEGTFNLCSFFYVEALARAGRLQQARYAFDKMLTYSNHVGLFAEEIGPSGEQLGNFPQAFTHLALIDAALALDDELDHLATG